MADKRLVRRSVLVNPKLSNSQWNRLLSVLKDSSFSFLPPRTTDFGPVLVQYPLEDKNFPCALESPTGLASVAGHIVQHLKTRMVVPLTLWDFYNPVVIVKQKDGTTRMCLDARNLLRRTDFNSQPLPVNDNLFRAVKGKT
jgi:hypothetical protein